MTEATVILSLLWIWFNFRFQVELTMNAGDDVPLILKWIYYNTDFKPFNCEFCLSVWISIIASICFLNVYLLSLPLIYNIIRKL